MNETGQAVPEANGGTTTTERPNEPPSSPAPGSTGPTVTIPARPEELPLDGIDACSLFTPAQLGQLKVNRPPRSNIDEGAYKGMRECGLNVQAQQPFYSYDVIAVTNEGVEAWLTGKRNVEAKLSSVAGFAAATYWIRGANGRNADSCTTSVDVARGQQLIVDTTNDGARSFTLEQLCQRAEQAAGLAVQTLRTLR